MKRKYCFNANHCFVCDKLLTCQAVDGIGLDCWKKIFKSKGSPCSRHGGGKSYWEKGQLIVECKDCGIECGIEINERPQIVIYDKNRTREVCGCEIRKLRKIKDYE